MFPRVMLDFSGLHAHSRVHHTPTTRLHRCCGPGSPNVSDALPFKLFEAITYVDGCLTGSRVVASTSTAHTASLHTTAVLDAQSRRAKARARGKVNAERRREVQEHALVNRPHIVLGHKPGDEAKWENCDLAQVVVSVEGTKPSATPPSQFDDPDVQPKYYNFGIGEQEKELLFKTLPKLTIEGVMTVRKQRSPSVNTEAQIAAREFDSASLDEKKKMAMLRRLVDLANADAKGIAYENRQRIVAEFSTPANLTDTGRPEVQGK